MICPSAVCVYMRPPPQTGRCLMPSSRRAHRIRSGGCSPGHSRSCRRSRRSSYRRPASGPARDCGFSRLPGPSAAAALAVRSQHVEIAVLARHIDPAASHGDRRGDRRAERRRERPGLAAGQRHDAVAIQAAVDDVLARQHQAGKWRPPGRAPPAVPAAAVPAQTQALLGLHPINIVAADAHRGEAQQAGQMDRRLGPLDEIRLNLAVGQAQFDPTRVVAAVPLDIDIAGFIGGFDRTWQDIRSRRMRGSRPPSVRSGTASSRKTVPCRHDDGLPSRQMSREQTKWSRVTRFLRTLNHPRRSSGCRRT